LPPPDISSGFQYLVFTGWPILSTLISSADYAAIAISFFLRFSIIFSFFTFIAASRQSHIFF
jgi:hypothetical protein